MVQFVLSTVAKSFLLNLSIYNLNYRKSLLFWFQMGQKKIFFASDSIARVGGSANHCWYCNTLNESRLTA